MRGLLVNCLIAATALARPASHVARDEEPRASSSEHDSIDFLSSNPSYAADAIVDRSADAVAGSSHAQPRSVLQTSKSVFRQTYQARSAHAPPARREHPRAFLVAREQEQIQENFQKQKKRDCSPPSYSNSVPLEDFAPFNATLATMYRYRQQQSVNLGSWFIHEKWMTPSVFDCAASPAFAEIDIARGWGGVSGARAVLEKHWDTWIVESDFAYLASTGINTVRLPIGYWNLGSDYCVGTIFEPVKDVYANAWPRVVHAINLAAKYNLGVLVDLHGAPGSQNGQDISGVSDGNVGLFVDNWNLQKALNVLTYLTQQLASVNNVVGIEILNEPKGPSNLESFYNTAISTMRAVSTVALSLPLYVHDAFDLNRFVGFMASHSDFVVIDHHAYYVFTDADAAESVSAHTNDVNTWISGQFQQASNTVRGNLVIDEWSAAVTPQSAAQESNIQGAQGAFGWTQESVYRKTTAGWSFWAYNLESCDAGWCFKAAIGNVLPSIFPSFGTDVINKVAVSDDLQAKLNAITLPDINSVLGTSGLLAPASTSAPVIGKAADSSVKAPANWWSGLEPYGVYHARYLLWGCSKQQGTSYWNTCCNPLLASQSVSVFPSQCGPQGTSSSAIATSATATPTTSTPQPTYSTPASWWSGLEDYTTYHIRYLAIGCSKQHGTDFFNTCCNPLLKGQNAATTLPAQCQPKSKRSEDLEARASTLSSDQAAQWTAFSDGFTIAVQLGQFNLSKLGFKGQYVADQLNARITAGTISGSSTGTYYDFFYKGVAAGEAAVIAAAQ